MQVKPAEGRAVRFPGTLRLLDKAGADVPETPFWIRALSRGDVQRTQNTPLHDVRPQVSDTPPETSSEKAPA